MQKSLNRGNIIGGGTIYFASVVKLSSVEVLKEFYVLCIVERSLIPTVSIFKMIFG